MDFLEWPMVAFAFTACGRYFFNFYMIVKAVKC